jgi:hypothetical protein
VWPAVSIERDPVGGWTVQALREEKVTVSAKGLPAALLVAGACLATSNTVLADPGGPNTRGVATYSCDNGQTVDMESGPARNSGRVGWVVDATTMFVVKYIAVTDGVDTFVFFDTTNGATDLTTCTTPGRPGDTFITEGFFTPRP